MPLVNKTLLILHEKNESRNDTPPSMIPASIVARIGLEIVKASDTKTSSESSMDAAIQKRFIGT